MAISANDCCKSPIVFVTLSSDRNRGATGVSGDIISVTPTPRPTRLDAELKALAFGGSTGRGNDNGWQLSGSKHHFEAPVVGKRVRRKTLKARQLEEPASEVTVTSTPATSVKGPPKLARSMIANDGPAKCLAKAVVCRKHKLGELDLSSPVTCVTTKPTMACGKCKSVRQALPTPARLRHRNHWVSWIYPMPLLWRKNPSLKLLKRFIHTWRRW